MTTTSTEIDRSMPRGFADGYRAEPALFDEMVEADGSLRPHWRMPVCMLDDLGREELARRWEGARRIIHENGVSHNVYGDPTGMDRPWSLDFAPLVIAAAEWSWLDDALVQRARLLDALLADLYGPRRLIAEGVLPPELVFANPGFLRPCSGVLPPGGRWLHLYSVDLGRAPDGRFFALSDRTQAPSGAGYTLENRIVLSRVLPTVFRQCNVQRLAPFFRAMRQMLASLAPAGRESPRVVLLTPGPYNETYFEHVYLARYLGYTLVQSNDLTVRDGAVFLKTLGGLQRVDVILRRVDDDFCDPLELRPESYLGVPGLLEAVRCGEVTVANALGSGVLQAPVFLPFLPALCKALLGEELKLPSIATWWCGQDGPRKYVLEHMRELVVKPAFPSRGSDPVFGELLSSAELSELAARINASPADYVAQEKIELSTAPAIVGDRLDPRRLVLRTYLSASNGSYVAMPGSMTRITGSAESLVVSLQRGGGSKDTWVLADGPVSEESLLTPAAQPVELSRGGGDLPSRVADDLYWLGRYVERVESLVRLARGTLSRLPDQAGDGGTAVLVRLLHELTGPAAAPEERPELDLLSAIFDPDNPASLRAAISSVHSLARVLRDRISVDMWRILNRLEQDLSAFNLDTGQDQLASVLELLNTTILRLSAFAGLASDSMTRGQAWRFLDVGRRLERAAGVTRLVHATMVIPADNEPALLEAVLDIADSSMTYRRRYFTQLQTPAVVDLLLADETSPHSAAFQLEAVEEHLASLPRDAVRLRRNADQQIVLRLLSALRLADCRAACGLVGGERKGLDALLAELREGLTELSDVISQTYFSHARVSRQLTAPGAT